MTSRRGHTLSCSKTPRTALVPGQRLHDQIGWRYQSIGSCGRQAQSKTSNRVPVLNCPEQHSRSQTTHPLGVADPDRVLVLWRHGQPLDQSWRQHIQCLPHQGAPPIWLARSQERHKHLHLQAARFQRGSSATDTCSSSQAEGARTRGKLPLTHPSAALQSLLLTAIAASLVCMPSELIGIYKETRSQKT